jgi:hypothetical protein
VAVTRSLLVLSLVVGASGSAAAQDVFEPALPVPAGAGVDTMVFSAVSHGPIAIAQPFGLVSVEPFETAQPVLRAPYSAEAVTEVTQDLPDGNRIANRMSAAIVRDGRGRVRREHQAVFVGPLVADREAPLVTIVDPVEGVHLTFDQERRVAFRTPAPPFVARHVTSGAVAGKGSARAPAGDATIAAAPSATFTMAIGPGIMGGSVDINEGTRVTTQLGDRSFEGVRATGTRTVTTIPAGQIGNQFPIQVVNERWYSPDLQVVVMSRRSDPRFGETVYRLINIVRAEPPADLFEVPPGFRVETMDVPLSNRP